MWYYKASNPRFMPKARPDDHDAAHTIPGLDLYSPASFHISVSLETPHSFYSSYKATAPNSSTLITVIDPKVLLQFLNSPIPELDPCPIFVQSLYIKGVNAIFQQWVISSGLMHIFHLFHMFVHGGISCSWVRIVKQQ